MHTILQTMTKQPVLLVFLGAFAVLMALMIPAYFYTYRPKPDSTEWIDRLDRRSFQPLRAHALSPADAVWTLLSMLCAVFLYVVYYLLRFDRSFKADPGAFLKLMLRHAVPLVLIALSLYLLIRLMYGKTLPAILCAIIGAITVVSFSQSKGIAMFSLSLLFLYLWICAPYDAPLFFNALWFAFSVAAYGVALLFTFPLIWAVPFYVGVYITMQIVRWKNGDPDARGKKLAGSLVLSFLLVVFGVLSVWLVYCVRHHKGGPIELLRSFSFYKRLFPALLDGLSRLLRRPSYFSSLVFSDAFCFIAGMIAVVPLLHGLIKLRDTRCLFLLLLLPCLLLAWYFSACYALLPALALIIGRCWCHYAQRGRPLYAVAFAATFLLFFYADIFIH